MSAATMHVKIFLCVYMVQLGATHISSRNSEERARAQLKDRSNIIKPERNKSTLYSTEKAMCCLCYINFVDQNAFDDLAISSECVSV